MSCFSPTASSRRMWSICFGIVPLVQRRIGVEPFVALQADQVGPERGGQDLGDLGLADSSLALDQHWLAELHRQVDRRGDGAVGDVVLALELTLDFGNLGKQWILRLEVLEVREEQGWHDCAFGQRFVARFDLEQGVGAHDRHQTTRRLQTCRTCHELDHFPSPRRRAGIRVVSASGRMSWPSVTLTRGRKTWAAPDSFISAGRTKTSNVTSDDTGKPGNPKINCRSRRGERQRLCQA